jgi:hypothetical protein
VIASLLTAALRRRIVDSAVPVASLLTAALRRRIVDSAVPPFR